MDDAEKANDALALEWCRLLIPEIDAEFRVPGSFYIDLLRRNGLGEYR